MYTLITISLVALFVFPLLTYGVMWFASRQRNQSDRPEPTRRTQSSRTIPGGRSNRKD